MLISRKSTSFFADRSLLDLCLETFKVQKCSNPVVVIVVIVLPYCSVTFIGPDPAACWEKIDLYEAHSSLLGQGGPLIKGHKSQYDK